MGNLHVFCVPVDHFLAIQFIANVNFLVEIMNDITPGNFPDHSHTECSHVISLKHGYRVVIFNGQRTTANILLKHVHYKRVLNNAKCRILYYFMVGNVCILQYRCGLKENRMVMKTVRE